MRSPDTTQDDAVGSSVLLPALERLALPALLFGAVFLVAAVSVTFLLTPDRFPVRIGDRSVRLIDLEAEQRKLLSEQAELSATKIAVPDSRSPVLHQLAVLKPNILPVGSILLAIDDARAHAGTDTTNQISLSTIAVGGSGTTIAIGGEVRDQAGSTIKTLASFVDRLRAISGVASVSEPEYSAQKDADGTNVSPFTLTFTLVHADR